MGRCTAEVYHERRQNHFWIFSTLYEHHNITRLWGLDATAVKLQQSLHVATAVDDNSD